MTSFAPNKRNAGISSAPSAHATPSLHPSPFHFLRATSHAMALLTTVATRAVQLPIHLYRYTLSPLIGPVCRYQPTCSAYALEALEKHGPIAGVWLAVRRLSRCHPVKWLGGSEGFDPVPDACAHHSRTPK